MENIYFKEIQKFNQFWIWIVIGILIAIWLWGIIQQIILGVPFGNRPVSDIGLILIGILVLIPPIIILRLRMITEVHPDGLYFKMNLFMRKFKKISPSDIKNYNIRKYKPLGEYGGWGIRYSVKKKKGKAYNVKGKLGLQLELKSGKKLLIGTGKPDNLSDAMNKMMNESKSN